MKNTRKSLLCLLLVLLLAAAALTGCTEDKPATTEAPKTQTQAQTQPQTEAPTTATQAPTETQPAAMNMTSRPQDLGEGERNFILNVTFSNGDTASYSIHTDAETVGKALLELNLIAGEESEYGLYVKTVGDETLDYDANHMYWAFYVNGEYATTGVDSTEIVEGAVYDLTATAG